MNRLNQIRNKLAELGLDALLVYDELNLKYLSEFEFSDGFLIITAYNAYLVTDFRYYEMALSGAADGFEVVMPSDRAAFIDEVLKKDNVISVGFEGNYVSFSSYTSLCEKHPDFKFVSIGDTIEVMRQIKTQDEIDKMQLAQNITDAAFSHLLGMITPNMTEIEVAAELEYAMKKNGADGLAFSSIAVSGDASALPHGTPRNVKLKRGFLTMDFGAKYQGYCSDMTRTIVIGKADNEIKKLYETVLSAQLAALEYLVHGRDAGEADKIARDIIDKDYKGTFGHSLGHAIGLLVHEMPALSPRTIGKKLLTGHVVSVEPGIYLFGKYGCRIEDMVAIRDDGLHNFTHSTKELIEIL